MSHIDNGFRSLSLKRFPETDDVNPLLAWEAADEYLLQQLDDTEISGPVLILNDTFGALGCALAEHTPYSIGDSYLSELATRENLRHNDIAESSVKFLDSTADYPQAPGVVLIKLPKTMALLEQQLRALREVVTPQTRIIAGAKARDIHTSTLELFEKVLGPTTTTLAWKKARLINGTFTKPALADTAQTLSWKLEGTDWTIHNHANVFSRTGLDIGARFFMEHLPENLEGEIVDLGCGNGVLGMTLLLHHWFGLSPSISGLVLNAACYIGGWRTLGRSFIFYSVIAGGGFSAFYAFFEQFDPLWPGLAQMPLVAAVVGALFVGVGAGLSVRAGGAPGGDDALAMALHKVLHQPIERIYLGSDLVVLALSASYLPLERLACSLLTVLLSGQIIGLIQRIPSPSARKAAALESTNK